eukprot:SAG11_NODE_6917_length_1225_cov_3.375666_1_plen_95_part_00
MEHERGVLTNGQPKSTRRHRYKCIQTPTAQCSRQRHGWSEQRSPCTLQEKELEEEDIQLEKPRKPRSEAQKASFAKAQKALKEKREIKERSDGE